MPDPSPLVELLPAVVRDSLENLLAHLTEPRQELPPSLAESRDLARSWLDAVSNRKRRFNLGWVCATPGVSQKIPPHEITLALARHQSGDWGDLDAHDWLENDRALRQGNRLLSAYRTFAGTRFWIITEADRSATTALLPEEY